MFDRRRTARNHVARLIRKGWKREKPRPLVRSSGYGHHHVSASYLYQSAAEAAWKEDNRRLSNGDAFRRTAKLALASPVSRQWKGYWERAGK